jgi:hypothetical protein
VPAAAFLLAAALAIQAAPAATAPPAAPVAAEPSGARVALTRVVWNLPRNAAYEVQQAGLLCITQHVLTWKGEPVVFEAKAYASAFRTAMRAAGVSAQGDLTELFESQEDPADLSVGALVTAARVRACEIQGFGAGSVRIRGEAAMTVEWQVLSRRTHAVVARVRTTAAATLPKPVPGDTQKLVAEGLAANAAELAKDAGFRQALAAAAQP